LQQVEKEIGSGGPVHRSSLAGRRFASFVGCRRFAGCIDRAGRGSHRLGVGLASCDRVAAVAAAVRILGLRCRLVIGFEPAKLCGSRPVVRMVGRRHLDRSRALLR
jgi:hypothetical protein